MPATGFLSRVSESFRSLRRDRSRRRRRPVHPAAAVSSEALEGRRMLTAELHFGFTAIASDLSPTLRFFGSPDPDNAPFTILRYGSGSVHDICGLPDLHGYDNITFSFGSMDAGSPVEALTLSSFDNGLSDGLANQLYTPDGNDNPALTVFDDGVPVATGEVTLISLETTPGGVVTSPASAPSRFRLTSAVGADTTIFDTIMTASGGTGEFDVTFDAFNLTGPWAGVGDAEIFSSDGAIIGLDGAFTGDDFGDDMGSAGMWDRSGTLLGYHEHNFDDDWIAVELQADTQYTFDLSGPGGLPIEGIDDFSQETEIQIRDDSGDLIADWDNIPGTGHVSVTVTAETTGTYYILLRAGGCTTWEVVQRSEVAVTPDDPDLVIPWDRLAPIGENIEYPRQEDTFGVELTAGVKYTFETTPGTLYDTELLLVDPVTEQVLEENDDAPDAEFDEYHSRLTFTPETSGSYLLIVRGYGFDHPTVPQFSDPFRVGTFELVQTEEEAPAAEVPVLHAIPSPTQNMRPEISWDASANADSYEVYISDASAPTTALVRATVTGTTFTPDVDLPIGVKIVWVRAFNAAGTPSGWSSSESFRINTAAMLTPETFTLDSAQPTFTWNPLAGAVSYDIWVANVTTGQSSAAQATGITGTSWSPDTPLNFGTHRVWVRGVDNRGGKAAWSASEVVWGSPQSIAPVNPTFDATPEFSWEAIPGATSYDLYIWNGGGPIEMNGLTETSYTPMADLAPGTSRWWVRAHGAGGSTSWSGVSLFNVTGKPVITTPISGNLLQWTPVDGATSYVVYINEPGVRLAVNETVGSPSYDLSALTAGNYRVWVRALHSGGSGLWSNPVDFTIS